MDDDFNLYLAKWFAVMICLLLLFLTIMITLTSGCVTFAKEQVHNALATPTPTPVPTTPEPTPTPKPTPVPVVTIDQKLWMLQTNGYYLRQWHHWFRENVQGINGLGTKDLSTWVTVYDYKLMDSYRWWSVSWARRFVVKPDDAADRFLFIFVNMYSDTGPEGVGGIGDVRQYGMGCDHFYVQIDDRLIYADYFEFPERRITEFDNMYTLDHTVTPGPYGYKIVQEKGTGIISAQELQWLMGGRSNAWDGYCIFQVPRKTPEGNPVNETNLHIVGRFDNLGGQAWWVLKQNPNT